jgi:hypothetical protein
LKTIAFYLKKLLSCSFDLNRINKIKIGSFCTNKKIIIVQENNGNRDELKVDQENLSMTTKKDENIQNGIDNEKIKTLDAESNIQVLNNFAFAILFSIIICSNMIIWLCMAY